MRAARSPLLVCSAGAAAFMVAMGIGRFAFTPMLPLMVREGILTAGSSPLLAAANYLGYLLGALMATRLRWRETTWSRFGLLGVVATTAAMGLVSDPLWWGLMRGLSGLFSGWVLVGVSAWAIGALTALGRPHWAAYAYSGVGLGIAAAGLFCWTAGPLQVPSSALWLLLGTAAALLALLSALAMRGDAAIAPRTARRGPDRVAGLGPLVLCYGVFGFGYILPATYLPLLAQRAVADPRMFGLVWPLFGVASVATIALAGSRWLQARRLRGWSVAQAAMGLGALLPVGWPGIGPLALSALLIGGTFMIATMLGMQEARARLPGHAVAALGRMTAAFATGQLAGPLLVLAGERALRPGLVVAGLALLASAAWLVALARRPAPQVFMASKKS